MSPDLKQNIFYTVFFIFLHNFSAIFYFTGIIISAFSLLIKPTRWKTLLLFGFIILLFAFEYKKHIVEPLKQQTINSLITVRQHYKTERAVNFVLVKVLPIFLPLSGWALVFIGIISANFRRVKKNK
ncbi:hypothetical protein A2954_03905 [Candidatus Roizmanbacteria bacterium RIFCSPLOWO2_01_FULL_37_12]|uniref:Uncharacterized protein n=1 Tax=Candidatus Roizmanbacteria bacterium RIFCSPLOWO2_01_FULL_37_12 TaxID=1802056 RepID=A0A1F7IEN3_9BACT|nr:MAG: hypothetical protein A3D76_02690 [Candidatus Roizmanbacteria bacterium RIFCSPHIGHO2_02_FULL_37_9b]OGK41829.1 MAG: hypothetical protein A2954_03905 [Candidatus Roizmanbacteria bacterium RIFCSPLOWO2_01_FULL_37_12]